MATNDGENEQTKPVFTTERITPTGGAGSDPTTVQSAISFDGGTSPGGATKWDQMSGSQKLLGCGGLVLLIGFVLILLLILLGLAVGNDDGNKTETTTTTTSAPVTTTAPPITELPVTEAPTTAAPATEPPTTAAPATTRAPATTAAPSSGGSASYANCTAAKDAGAAPLYRGDPGYSSKLDRDGDGVACES